MEYFGGVEAKAGYITIRTDAFSFVFYPKGMGCIVNYFYNIFCKIYGFLLNLMYNDSITGKKIALSERRINGYVF